MNRIHFASEDISLLELDYEENNVWNWGVKNHFSYHQLEVALCESRLNSISRFLSAFLREFYEKELFQTPDCCENSLIDNYCKKGNLIVEKIVKLAYVNSRNNQLIILIEKEFALGKFLITRFPVLFENKKLLEITSVNYLIGAFENTGVLKKYNMDDVMADLRISNANLFLARLLRMKNLPRDAVTYQSILNFTCDWDQETTLVFFEQWCIDGHLLHPTPKSKSGLTMDDIIRYAPESKNFYELQLIAVPRNLAAYHSNAGMNYDDYMKDIFKSKYDDLRNDFESVGLFWEDYYVVPVHPWQYFYIHNNQTTDVIDANSLKGINALNIRGAALISFRTLLLENSNKFVKLPLDVCITSSGRQLSPRASYHAVYISGLISDIKSQQGLSEHFEFEKDEVSIYLSRHVGVVYREEISKFVNPKSISMPSAALFEKSPLNQNISIIDDILILYKQFKKFKNMKEAVVNFFTEYTGLVIKDVIRLLTIYGIGCEAHLQNSIIVFEQFSPSKIIIRDAEDINVCLTRLKHHFPDCNFFPGSWNVTAGSEDSQKVVMHSLIHSHIGLLIYHCSTKYGIEEFGLWDIVKKVLRVCFQSIKETCYSVTAQEDEDYFFSSQTNIKSLLKMKIANQGGNKFIYTKFNNPLRD